MFPEIVAVGVPELTLMNPNLADAVDVPPIKRSTVDAYLGEIAPFACSNGESAAVIYPASFVHCDTFALVKFAVVNPARVDSSMFVPVTFPVNVEFVKLRVNPVPVDPLVSVPTVVRLLLPAHVESAVFSTFPSPTFALSSEVIHAGSAYDPVVRTISAVFTPFTWVAVNDPPETEPPESVPPDIVAPLIVPEVFSVPFTDVLSARVMFPVESMTTFPVVLPPMVRV